MIHDKICESRKVNSVDFYAEALWVRLLTKADDNGNYYRDVRRVHANCMLEKPEATEQATEKALRALLKVGLLQQYESDGRKYIHLADFHDWQDLRTDKNTQIDHPIHPYEMGGAYVGEGLRRDTWQEPNAIMLETQRRPVGNRSVTEMAPAGSPKEEVEVEVKDQEEEEVVAHTEIETPEPNFKSFQSSWKQAAGKKPKPFPALIEQYEAICRKYGEDEVLNAINDWVEQKGGRLKTAKNEWGPKNFLEDDAEDILDAKIDEKNYTEDKSSTPGRPLVQL
jgi:hypothetical protein